MAKTNLKTLWRLKPSTKLCTDFYVFDTETGVRKKDGYIYWCLNAQPKSFIFGVIYGLNYTKVIHSVKEFKETLLDPRFKNKKIFAHNAQYDLNTLYGNIFELDPNAIFNGKFICATNGNCHFADSGNIFVGASVETIGKMMGLFKGKLGGPGYRSKGITSKDINYCIRDCQIIYDALFSMFEFAGEIRITQASLCMTYFRRFHQPYHIQHNENTKFFWESYYGGRTEVFKLGKTHAKSIDVNSMYPFCMKTIKFPNPKLLKHEINLSVKLFIKYLQWYEGMAYLDIFHKESWIGFLPVKKDTKLLFPIGNISGAWNFNEIRFALEYGVIEIKKVHRVIYSEPMPSPFVSYVETLQEQKLKAELEGNAFNRDRSKRFSNSLYGKFAQRITEQSIYISDIEKEWDTIQQYQREGKFIRLVTFNKKRNDAFLIVSNTKQFNISYSIPSFSSYITSAARVILLQKLLELKNNRIVYCDTDSIFFEIDNGIVSNMELGGWKIENKIITEIKGLKNYKYIAEKGKEVWRVKGVPVNKGKTLKIYHVDESETEVQVVQQISDNKFRYYNLVKSKEALKRNIEPGVIMERLKEIKNTYDKRIILKDGETKPIKL
jgi:DNA polymerase type B, organellar and viral.